MNALGQYLPSLNISYGAYNSSGGQFIQGELVPYKGYPWNYGKGYSASLLLFDGGQRWFSYLQAQANQRANAENETLQRYGIAYTVKQQYYSVLQARELEAAGASALEQAQVALNASSARVKVGAVVRTDSLRAAIQVGSARLSLLNARAQLRDANAALTRLVASNVPVTAVAADTSDVPRIDVDDASLSRMADDGPNVRQAIASFDAAKQGRRATITSQFLPRVSANYNYSASAFPTPDFNWGGGPSASKQTFYSFGLSYAIFNNFSRELNTMVATVAEDNAEAALRDARFNAKANLAQLVDQFRTAAQTIELQQLQITAAQEDLAAQQSRYALGASSYLDLLTSQTALDSQRPSFPLHRAGRQPRELGRRRHRRPEHLLRGRGVGRHLEDDRRRRPLVADLRRPAGLVGRRARRRAVEPEHRVGGNRRAVDPQPHLRRQRRLQVHRCRPHVDAHGARRHRPHRPHRDRSRESRHRVHRGAGPQLRAAAGARRLSHEGRRQDVGARALRRREHGRDRRRHAPDQLADRCSPRCGSSSCTRGDARAAARAAGSSCRATAAPRGRDCRATDSRCTPSGRSASRFRARTRIASTR